MFYPLFFVPFKKNIPADAAKTIFPRFYNIRRLNSMDFQLIMDLCQQGDSQGQMSFYEMFCRSVYNSSFRILNDSSEAEDVMQDTFMTVLGKLDKFRGDQGGMRGYLCRIAVNRSIDICRKRHITWVPLDDEHTLIPDESEPVRDLKAEEISEALMHLPDGYRMVLSLRLLEEMEFEEIAAQMRIAPSSVRSQFARARKKLVEMLNEKQEI